MSGAAPNVLLVVTQDTKEVEGRFLRQCLEQAGCKVHHLDASVRRVVGGAEISPDEVAAATGRTLEQIRAIGHEGKIQEVMVEGATKLALALHEKIGLSGVLSIGGSMGTTLGTAVMRALPYGLPKMMVSTLASGMTAGFVGLKDISMMNAVTDIAGINSISEEVYRNAAFGLAGMALNYRPSDAGRRPLVLISTLGTTETAMQRVRKALEADGFEVMAFHTTGTGGRTLEAIAAERDIAAIVDMSLVEINDLLNNGICTAGPERGTTGVSRGIPTVFAPGNVDFYIMPSQLAVGDAPFEGRRFHIHNAILTAVRTTESDLERLGDHLAGILQQRKGPVQVCVPLRGFSSHDSTEGKLHEPSLPPKFAAYLAGVLPKDVPLQQVDSHINDPAFSDALIAAVRKLTGRAA